ncbi:hypothetical protein OG943_32845 [Amycolatopsis sp. NBC_00345]|uniref:hypothetical protein n=1 Tax=Amycolatopsis sp. NBC_00345 TaxID=2975955 RepID=UPI002E26C2BB
MTRLDHVRELVDALELPATIAPEALAAKLAQSRGRPIKVLPYPEVIVAGFRHADEPLPYGVWIDDPAADYVFYRTDTTPSHQRHIILHELGHISCRHVGNQVARDPVDEDEPDQAAVIGAVKRAGGFAEDQEQAAESFAYLIERQTRPNLSATGETPADRYRLLED